MNNKVSVVIPTYNCAQYLQEAIDSALNQTYQNIEIIIIDDGSTDNTSEILKSYSNNKKVIIYQQPNQGLSAARNKGIELSTGAYITFLDSDDILDIKFCELLMDKINKHHCDMAITNLLSFKNKDEIKNKKEATGEKIYTSLKTYLNDKEDLLARVISCAKIYNKNIFKNVRFKVGVFHEDEFIFLDIAKQAKTIFYTKKQLYYYRFNMNGITKSKPNNKKTSDAFNAYRLRAKELRKLHFTVDDYAVINSLHGMSRRICKNVWSNPKSIKRLIYIECYYYYNFLIQKMPKKIKYLLLMIVPFVHDIFNA